MMQKFGIVVFALLGIACFAMFFALQQTPTETEAIVKPTPPVTLQLDTVPLGTISMCGDVLVAGNDHGELRIFSQRVANSKPQIFQLSKYAITAPVLEKNGLYYVGDVSGMFWAFDPAAGTVKWSHKTGNQIIGQAVWYNDMVFVGSHDCDFYAFQPETGELLFTVECGGQINAAPVISERLNAVFFGNCDGFLRKIDIAAKSIANTLDMQSPIPENIVMRDDTLYVLSHQGDITAVDCESFEIIYRVKTPNEYLSSPYATETFLFLTDYNGDIHVHSREDGTRLTTLQSPEKMTSLQAGDDSRVFAVSTRGKPYQWQRENDQWHETLLADLQTDCRQSCVLAGNHLFIADDSGGLFDIEVLP